MSKQLPTYTAAEVAERNFKGGKDCWLIYKNNVYDVTHYVDDHPGGPDLVTDWAGKDCTKAFHDAGHSAEALKDFKKYKIGTLATAASADKSNMSKEEEANKKPTRKRACFMFC